MMKVKNIIKWFYEYVHSYNLFIPEEDDYPDDNDQLTDQAELIKKQKYSTRLYIILFISKEHFKSF
jgi:hypothetical protein